MGLYGVATNQSWQPHVHADFILVVWLEYLNGHFSNSNLYAKILKMYFYYTRWQVFPLAGFGNVTKSFDIDVHFVRDVDRRNRVIRAGVISCREACRWQAVWLPCLLQVDWLSRYDWGMSLQLHSLHRQTSPSCLVSFSILFVLPKEEKMK